MYSKERKLCSFLYFKVFLYKHVLTNASFSPMFKAILPFGLGTIPDEYANGSNEEQTFIQNPALFFTVFVKVRSST